MNVEIGIETVQLLSWEYMNGIFVAVHYGNVYPKIVFFHRKYKMVYIIFEEFTCSFQNRCHMVLKKRS
jgi:hypothetical protein